MLNKVEAIKKAYEKGTLTTAQINIRYRCNSSEMAKRYGWVKRQPTSTITQVPINIIDLFQYKQALQLTLAKFNEYLPKDQQSTALQLMELDI